QEGLLALKVGPEPEVVELDGEATGPGGALVDTDGEVEVDAAIVEFGEAPAVVAILEVGEAFVAGVGGDHSQTAVEFRDVAEGRRGSVGVGGIAVFVGEGA